MAGRIKFSPVISPFVKCKDQAELDLYRNKLIAGGSSEDNYGCLQDTCGTPGRSSPTPSAVTSAILIAREPALCRPCSR